MEWEKKRKRENIVLRAKIYNLENYKSKDNFVNGRLLDPIKFSISTSLPSSQVGPLNSLALHLWWLHFQYSTRPNLCVAFTRNACHSSRAMAPMAPLLLGGYDASMRRNGANSAAEGPNHPYKTPKAEGTPAVLVTSSLEDVFSCFFFSKISSWTIGCFQVRRYETEKNDEM